MTVFRYVDPDSRVDQGDVFQKIYFSSIDAFVTAVVVTPTCDLEHEKADFVKFVSTVSLDYVIKIMADSVGIDTSSFNSSESIKPKQCDNLVKAVQRNVTGDFLPRFYLLPEYQSVFPASYLDFQRVFVLPTRLACEDYLTNRVAKVPSPWREQIVAQFSGYSMRIGTPDYADEELKSLLVEAGLKLPP